MILQHENTPKISRTGPRKVSRASNNGDIVLTIPQDLFEILKLSSSGCGPRPGEGSTRRNSAAARRIASLLPSLSVFAVSQGPRVESAICPSETETIIRKGDAIRNEAGDDATMFYLLPREVIILPHSARRSPSRSAR